MWTCPTCGHVNVYQAKTCVRCGRAADLDASEPEASNLKRKSDSPETHPLEELAKELANREIGKGLLWLIGGGIVSLVSYSAAADQGDEYYVFYGAVLYGAYRFARGLWFYAHPMKLLERAGIQVKQPGNITKPASKSVSTPDPMGQVSADQEAADDWVPPTEPGRDLPAPPPDRPPTTKRRSSRRWVAVAVPILALAVVVAIGLLLANDDAPPQATAATDSPATPAPSPEDDPDAQGDTPGSVGSIRVDRLVLRQWTRHLAAWNKDAAIFLGALSALSDGQISEQDFDGVSGLALIGMRDSVREMQGAAEIAETEDVRFALRQLTDLKARETRGADLLTEAIQTDDQALAAQGLRLIGTSHRQGKEVIRRLVRPLLREYGLRPRDVLAQ